MPLFIIWGIFLFVPVFLIRYLFLVKTSKRMRWVYAVLMLFQILLFVVYYSMSEGAKVGDPAGRALSGGYAALISLAFQVGITIVMVIIYIVHFSSLSKAEKALIADERPSSPVSFQGVRDREKEEAPSAVVERIKS